MAVRPSCSARNISRTTPCPTYRPSAPQRQLATRALPYPVRAKTKVNNTTIDGDNKDAPPAFGVAIEPVVTEKHNTTTTASEAFIAASHLPILSWFSQRAASCIGIFAMFAYLTGLILLFYYFRTSCPRQYAILPNEWDATDTPSSITDLEATDGVTIISTYLIHYKAYENFTQLGATYWMPFAITCGICEEECQLASCVGTTPITVEYDQCNAWGEAFSLATGLLVYINVALTLILAAVLCLIPRSHHEDAKPPSLWDYVKMIAQTE